MAFIVLSHVVNCRWRSARVNSGVRLLVECELKMLLPRFMLLLCATLLILACGGDSVRNGNLAAGPTPNAVPSDTLITLERGSCFGPCPIYKLAISADGVVVFEGKRYVKTTGLARGQISQESLRQLISEFEKIDYFSLSDNYGEVTVIDKSSKVHCPESSTDRPSATTSIRVNGRSKSVYHYYGCEGTGKLTELKALESKIDEVADSQRWVE